MEEEEEREKNKGISKIQQLEGRGVTGDGKSRRNEDTWVLVKEEKNMDRNGRGKKRRQDMVMEKKRVVKGKLYKRGEKREENNMGACVEGKQKEERKKKREK